MKKKNMILNFLLFSTLYIVLLSGCTATRVNLPKTGAVSVEAVASDIVTIEHVAVYKENGCLSVT